MTTNSQPTNTPHYPEQVTGMYILARALKNVGIETVYGLVGIPITEAAYMIQGQGIRFVGFRHEQQAGMAAATDGFLTKNPGVLMTVSSLGFMNGLTATANATVNCYPMIQISGASDPAMVDMNMGTYEQLDQFNTAKPVVKAAFRCSKAEDIPSAVARAYRAAVSGRPGGVYIDMTTPALGQVMNREDAEKLLYQPVDIYSPVAPNQESVDRAVKLLASAKRPAILLGKALIPACPVFLQECLPQHPVFPDVNGKRSYAGCRTVKRIVMSIHYNAESRCRNDHRCSSQLDAIIR